ncbi:sulfite exporter TauE/SafE family protein [Hoylesella oralis]|uniref:sulfite exporter TauE/SafE family protein n=1 Tax=Hoylesella oralis TaxID=28134 RepID=UPI0036178C24
MYVTLFFVGLIAGILSGSVGFGGGMVLLPVITYFYGIEVAVPVATIAQLMSNLSRAAMGWREIHWRQAAWFLLPAIPFTALGALGFSLIDKTLMTRVLCVFLIVFSVMKLRNKIHLPAGKQTMLVGGALTGLINGLLGISGPLNSAVFFTLDLSPIAYIVSEAAAAAAMHVVKAVTYGKFDLMDIYIFLYGFFIGCAMMAGNFIALHLIRYARKKLYQQFVAIMMIAVSLWLFFFI